MKANELRIGNWINDNGYNSIIGVIDSHYHAIQISGSPRMIALETIEPIPLTEEWLIKFGFDLQTDDEDEPDNLCKTYWSNDKLDYINYDSKENEFIIMGYSLGIKIYFIHQLQNIYFVLTGEELTIS